ncbi:MAG: type II toxin-antitoxin system VapC family toxin [Chthoniobacteraceae bacterium]
MSYWDTSALVKLSVVEADSSQFHQLAGRAAPIVTAAITRFEARSVFRRREAEGSLPTGEAVRLSGDMERDIARGKITVQAENAEMEKRFNEVLERCYSQTPPVFIRTNDALHLASVLVAGEKEFVSADARQRAAAVLLGLNVLP